MATAKTKAAPAHEAPAVHTESKGKRTVTVACKFPVGIILQLCRKQEYVEEGLNGSRTRVRWDKVGEKYVLRGPAIAADNVPLPKGWKRPSLEGGYALTPGIPADFWEQWLEQNKDNPLVLNKQVFAADTRDAVEGLAGDHSEVVSGFEPMGGASGNPEDDPRMPKSMNPSVDSISTADRNAA